MWITPVYFSFYSPLIYIYFFSYIIYSKHISRWRVLSSLSHYQNSRRTQNYDILQYYKKRHAQYVVYTYIRVNPLEGCKLRSLRARVHVYFYQNNPFSSFKHIFKWYVNYENFFCCFSVNNTWHARFTLKRRVPQFFLTCFVIVRQDVSNWEYQLCALSGVINIFPSRRTL